jgi:two-component system response regulator HydG
VILSAGEFIAERDMPLLTRTSQMSSKNTLDTGVDLAGQSLEEVERQAVMATLEASKGNKSEAARRLGITRATLHNKMKKYGVG